ncbi:MAG: hypothetical protein R3C11_19445 [Planctomycetaceae bacterium]
MTYQTDSLLEKLKSYTGKKEEARINMELRKGAERQYFPTTDLC